MIQATPLQKLALFFNKYKTFQYQKREIVLGAESTSTNIFYIKKGYMRAYKISEQGEELTLVILKPNDFYPMTWISNNLFSNCYLEAITSLEVWKAPQEQFLEFIKLNNDVFYELMNLTLVRFGGLLTRMEYLITGRAYTKVAATLLVCAKRFGEKRGKSVLVNLPLTHKDIATLVGITRETTCLEMKKLEKKGLIAHYGRLLLVKDIEKLQLESMQNSETELLLSNSL